MAETATVIWQRDNLTVTVDRNEDGGLTIFGHDLAGWGPGSSDYEYAVTVDAGDIPVILAALGGRPGDDVVPLLVANAETIVATVGETAWLKSLGIEPQVWNHVDFT
ncbi:MAG TPA: hypothetical protein VIJ96_20235 [Acidothermaceae bacterium]